MINLISEIIKWINSDEIRVLLINPKTIYLLNRLCKFLWIWSKFNYIHLKLGKSLSSLDQTRVRMITVDKKH